MNRSCFFDVLVLNNAQGKLRAGVSIPFIELFAPRVPELMPYNYGNITAAVGKISGTTQGNITTGYL